MQDPLMSSLGEIVKMEGPSASSPLHVQYNQVFALIRGLTTMIGSTLPQSQLRDIIISWAGLLTSPEVAKLAADIHSLIVKQ